MSEPDVEHLGLSYVMLDMVRVVGVGEASSPAIGKVMNVMVDIGGISRPMIFYVLKKSQDLVFGRPFEFTFQAHYGNNEDGSTHGYVKGDGKEVKLVIRTGPIQPAPECNNLALNKNNLSCYPLTPFIKTKNNNCEYTPITTEASVISQTAHKRVADKIKPRNVLLPLDVRWENMVNQTFRPELKLKEECKGGLRLTPE